MNKNESISQWPTISDLIVENTRLKDEALGWHARAHELEIKLNQIEEEKRLLAIENVRLMNRPNKESLRQYANNENS